jgi:hypothetical protein
MNNTTCLFQTASWTYEVVVSFISYNSMEFGFKFYTLVSDYFVVTFHFFVFFIQNSFRTKLYCSVSCSNSLHYVTAYHRSPESLVEFM